jgi:peptidylamidoglycolate lyase
MIRSLTLIACCILLAFCGNSNHESENSESDTIEEYVLDSNWIRFPVDYVIGNPTGIGIDSEDHLWIFHRAGRQWLDAFPDSAISANTVMEIDTRTGEILRQWGAGLFIMPHGLHVDRENNIWLTDVARHQVFKFDRNGKLLMKIGQLREAGTDSAHFNMPTDVAVADDGSFYVSDGYGNSRVMKFSRDGTFLFAWGKAGNANGEFNTPHAVDLDSAGNVYVADRENCRIQKFAADGSYLSSWNSPDTAKVYSVVLNYSGTQIVAVDYKKQGDTLPLGSNITMLDSRMTVQRCFGRVGHYAGPVCRYHDVETDSKGNIYTGDILEQRVQRFRKTQSVVPQR